MLRMETANGEMWYPRAKKSLESDGTI